METSDLLKRVRRIEIKTKALTNNVFAGEYHSAFKGRGMSFAEVREYQPGDDVRDIDWHVTARMNRPYVKVLEQFGTHDRTQRELTAEVAATLAFSAMKNNDKIGVIFFTDRIEKFIPPQKGRRHVLRIIRELLDFHPQGGGTDVAQALEYLVKVQRKHAIVFLLSDFLTQTDFSRQLLVASRRHDVVALRLYDRCMEQIPDVGLLKVKDAETGREMVIDTSSTAVRRHQLLWWAKHQALLDELFRKHGVDSTLMATDSDYVKPLINLLARR